MLSSTSCWNVRLSSIPPLQRSSRSCRTCIDSEPSISEVKLRNTRYRNSELPTSETKIEDKDNTLILAMSMKDNRIYFSEQLLRIVKFDIEKLIFPISRSMLSINRGRLRLRYRCSDSCVLTYGSSHSQRPPDSGRRIPIPLCGTSPSDGSVCCS
jgi:hypothetical protein